MRDLLLFFACCLLFTSSFSQESTPAIDRWDGFEKRKALSESSIVKNLPFENIGPTIMSGRVVDIEVDPDNSTHFYVAYASGGLWETTNNGTTFNPIFDNEIVITIGDIAVDWRADILYVGTGENNSSRSSYSGVGVFRSVNNGKTWSHIGLDESHHIGKIVIHPTLSNTIYVAVLGHLYSANGERGIYKTTNAGVEWTQVYSSDENCGGIDITINADHPDILYASMWQRERKSWNFTEGGINSEIIKSIDGGDSWYGITGDNGFPKNENIGRIGLAYYHSSGKDIEEVIYAFVDNQNEREKEDDEDEGLKKDDLRTMTKEAFLNLDQDLIEEFLEDNNFAEEYDLDRVLEMISENEISPIALVEYLEDANSELFDVDVIGSEIYRSDDGGDSWFKTHDEYIDDLTYSYGYYFGLIRVHPSDPEELYIAGVPILVSKNGGKTFESINGDNVHVDHHALWIDPENRGHMINGNDGGINISYDGGENWIKCNSPAVGQFYTVQVDFEEPYNVYGGLQDNGVWKGPSNYEPNSRWHQNGNYQYSSILGGDGMQIMVDRRDSDIIYTGLQFGNYYRINLANGSRSYITPGHKLGERPYRFNWQTPIWLSIHNQDIIYMGSQKLHRSMNQGEDWKELSDDLTWGGKIGNVPFGTITTIHESPLEFGLIYVGTDDGLVHLTKDGGRKWENVTQKLSKNLWISRIKASAFKESRVYVAMNGYRWDDFKPYLYVSEDFGETWVDLGINLPDEPINCFLEDPVNENVLYVGTDNGLYVSLDRGKSFMTMSGNLPAVAVHDMVIQPIENDLVIGTHGRSIYKANIESIQLLDEFIMNSEVYIFDIDPVMYSEYWGDSWSKWFEADEPEVDFTFFSLTDTIVNIQIKHDDLVVWNIDIASKKGLNFYTYDLTIDPEIKDILEEYLNNPPSEGEIEDEEIEDFEKIEIEEKDNGKYYLTAGEYEVILSIGDIEMSDFLILEEE